MVKYSMRILGIDPGTINSGYGVVDADEEIRMVDFGVFSFSRRTSKEKRLYSLYCSLSEIIARYRPDEMAIEEPFVGLNARSAFAIGTAQAIAILAGASQQLPIYYYSPAQVKLQVTGYGRGDKRQIQEMVRIQLGLPQYPEPSDAADALAVAICHIQQSCLNRRLANKG